MKQRIVVIVGSAAALLLLVGWFLLLYKPKSDELGQVEKDIVTAETEQVTLQTQLQKLQALKEQEPEIDAQLARVKSLVPDSPDLATYIREANRVSDDAGVDWVKVAPTEPTAGTDLSTIAITVELQGGYFNVVDYLTRMEELSRAVTFDSIQITPQVDQTSGKSWVNVQLTGRMFASGSGAPAPAATGSGQSAGSRPTEST